MNFSKKRVTNSGGTRIGCHANHGTGDAIGNAPITKTATIDTATSTSRWDAVLNRDKALDGEFVYAVKTTGVYCRASCASRTAKRINVVFFDTTSDAKVAGFRPCKRCHPDGTSFEHRRNDTVYAACERIRQSAATLSLNELASVSNLSPHHFHRVFKSVTGVTPKEYQKAIQQTRVRDALSKNRTVTEAIYEAGFNSSGRFYASSTAILGMTPQRYQKGGVNEEICYALVSCSMGLMMVAATQRGVCSIEFGDHGDSLIQQLHERFPRAMFLPGDKTFRIWLSRILKYLDQSGHHPGEWQKNFSICRSIFRAHYSSNRCGKRCEIFQREKPLAIAKWRKRSASPKPFVRWLAHAPATLLQYSFPVIAWFDSRASYPAIVGALRARQNYCVANLKKQKIETSTTDFSLVHRRLAEPLPGARDSQISRAGPRTAGRTYHGQQHYKSHHDQRSSDVYPH